MELTVYVIPRQTSFVDIGGTSATVEYDNDTRIRCVQREPISR